MPDPTPCRHPLPPDTGTWAVEVATALEAAHDPAFAIRLDGGGRLEAEDPREAVVLAAVRARGADLGVDDIAAACEELASFETEAGIDAAVTGTETIAWRYRLAHVALGCTETEPEPAEIAAIAAAAEKLL